MIEKTVYVAESLKELLQALVDGHKIVYDVDIENLSWKLDDNGFCDLPEITSHEISAQRWTIIFKEPK